MAPLRIGILGSGKGSNCRAILEQIRSGTLPNVQVQIVVSDVADAAILEIAREFGVRAEYVEPGNYRTRLTSEAEEQFVRLLRETDVELVVLAGFMRVLKQPMLDAFPHRIINLHPSLLPNFPGLAAWKQALAAGAQVTGCTVHYVDAGVDTGEIIAQREVPVLPDDTPETLHARIQEQERQLYPEVIGRLAAARLPNE
jgi:phosphoribosylglycinamide formyltransferase 1